MSRRMSYQFVDSSTGCWLEEIEVMKADPTHWGRGIFECAIGKMSVRDIKVSDQLTEEECSPVFKSLVIVAESDT